MLLVGLAAVGRGQSGPAAVPRSSILIVGVSPATFVDGVETETEITVAYELLGHAQGIVDVSSNTLRPQSFSPFTSQIVNQGSGTLTLRGKFTPRIWSSNIPTKINVHLGVAPGPLGPRTAVGSDQRKIAVASRPGAPETQASNPNPRDVYEDSITIKSVSPAVFVEGKEVEIVVVVRYELLSREEGEINLGITRESGTGYTIKGKTRVKIGAGETSVTAKVIPKRTGSLPFSKVHVNLSEYPHRRSWSPLATDAETVEVQVGPML
jgi:hypothetical protein